MIQKEQVNDEQMQAIDKEIQILKKIKHKNIVEFIEMKRTKNNWYLIFEYCEYGDLEKHFKKIYTVDKTTQKWRIPEEIAQKIMYQVAQAFKIMRENNIVHRDLKLANILINKDCVIKLADFGFAKYKDDKQLLTSVIGTPITMAPEVLCEQPYDEKCDIWSLGIIIYQMLYGMYPFYPTTKQRRIEDLIKQIKQESINFPKDVQVSNEVKEFICKLLVPEAKNRLSFQEFFNHPWILQGQFESVEENKDNEVNPEQSKSLKDQLIERQNQYKKQNSQQSNNDFNEQEEKNQKFQVVRESEEIQIGFKQQQQSENQKNNNKEGINIIPENSNEVQKMSKPQSQTSLHLVKKEIEDSQLFLFIKFKQFLIEKLDIFSNQIQQCQECIQQLNKFQEFASCQYLFAIFAMQKIKNTIMMDLKIECQDYQNLVFTYPLPTLIQENDSMKSLLQSFNQIYSQYSEMKQSKQLIEMFEKIQELPVQILLYKEILQLGNFIFLFRVKFLKQGEFVINKNQFNESDQQVKQFYTNLIQICELLKQNDFPNEYQICYTTRHNDYQNQKLIFSQMKELIGLSQEMERNFELKNQLINQAEQLENKFDVKIIPQKNQNENEIQQNFETLQNIFTKLISQMPM